MHIMPSLFCYDYLYSSYYIFLNIFLHEVLYNIFEIFWILDVNICMFFSCILGPSDHVDHQMLGTCELVMNGDLYWISPFLVCTCYENWAKLWSLAIEAPLSGPKRRRRILKRWASSNDALSSKVCSGSYPTPSKSSRLTVVVVCLTPWYRNFSGSKVSTRDSGTENWPASSFTEWNVGLIPKR